jgi:chromosome partitioning protein
MQWGSVLAMPTITVANLKGGTTKTTTAAYLAHALPQVLAVDADPPGSLLRWSELASWPLPVIGLAVKDIHTRLPGIAASYDHVVIDTPPLDDQAGIVYSALRAADVVVVPVGPTTMELDRLTPILEASEEIGPLRDRPLKVRVLLTRVVGAASSGANAREVLVEAGLDVLSAHVPRLERYAQAFGSAVQLTEGDPYLAVAKELLA